MKASLEEYKTRFWSKVCKTEGCWIWTGARFPHGGYGAFSMNGEPQIASRLAYEWSVGSIPLGMFVLHHCDNPPCVNPDHLFLGSAKSNTDDMMAKGRGKLPSPRRGEKNNKAILTESQVEEMRQLRKEGMTFAALSKLFGTCRSNVYWICSDQTWRHVGS